MREVVCLVIVWELCGFGASGLYFCTCILNRYKKIVSLTTDTYN